MINLRWILCTASLALAGAASAHHSGAMFDVNKDVTLEGTVKGWDFTAPHSWLHVITTGPDGKPVEWSLEGGPPGGLLRKDSFKAGDKVSVQIHPMKDGRPAGTLGVATFPDGHKVGVRPPT
jgi:hypothetical protein